MEEGERERCDLARRWFWGGTGEEDEEESEGPGLSAELSEERDIKTEAADGEGREERHFFTAEHPAPVDRLSSEAAAVVLCGEGDFSFARALVRLHAEHARHGTKSSAAVRLPRFVCTSFDDAEEVERRYGETSSSAIAELKELGATVLHGVDATKLAVCSALLGALDDPRSRSRGRGKLVVVFQFPHHPGKGRIDVNRALLGGFFRSAVALVDWFEMRGADGGDASADAAAAMAATLTSATPAAATTMATTATTTMTTMNATAGASSAPVVSRNAAKSPHKLSEIRVTLARGQGGTAADGVHMREWGNSWQLANEAHGAGLVLRCAFTFAAAEWHGRGYGSRGRRRRGAGEFRTSGATCHVLVKE